MTTTVKMMKQSLKAGKKKESKMKMWTPAGWKNQAANSQNRMYPKDGK